MTRGRRSPARLAAAIMTAAIVTMPMAGAVAQAGSSTSVGGSEGVTVYLAAPDRAALHRLAARTDLTWAQRQHRLAGLRPSSYQVQEVRSSLIRAGMHVTATSAWTVSASASASHVRSLFGSARSVLPHAHLAQALPTMPASLRPFASAVFGGDEVRPVAHPIDWTASSTPPNPGVNGTQIRQAYDAAKPADGHGAIVATIQLSDWDPAALSSYASSIGQPNPVANGHFRAVMVDGGPDNTDGFDEVALDQEALFGVAPAVRQRAYFAPMNSTSTDGYLDALYAVGDDAARPSLGQHMVALSTSWGFCEDTSSAARSAFRAYEDALSYVTASGLTVFASSGDSGSWCPGASGFSSKPTYPASSPSVVAVGGTGMVDGTHDTSWSCRGGCGSIAADCQSGNGCSGGGSSALFPTPSWQAKVPAGGGRSVPDIAAVGDPSTGLGVYVTAPGHCTGSATCDAQIGGTSLSAPVSAALLADELVAQSHPWGLGDLHRALYSAPLSDFGDVADAGTNGRYHAVAGYDRVTGLGTVDWRRLVTALVPDPPASVLVIGAHHHVYLHSGTHYRSLGGDMTGAPSAVSLRGRDIYFAVGRNGTPYVRDPKTTWTALASRHCLALQALVSGSLLITTCESSSHAASVAITSVVDGKLPHASGWTNLGGNLIGAPAPAVVQGRAVVIGTRHDGTVVQSRLGRSSSGALVGSSWRSIGYHCATQPTVASVGSVSVFACAGSDHHVHTATRTGSKWPSLRNVGGNAHAAVGLTLAPSRRATAYAVESDHHLHRVRIWPSLGHWNSLGGQWTGGAGAALSTASTTLTSHPLKSTALGLNSTANSVSDGQSVTFTTTVNTIASGTPTGVVSFEDAATGEQLGVTAVDGGGQAHFSVALPTGTHKIIAYYSGGNGFGSSNSTRVTIDVQPVALSSSSTTLAVAPNPATAGDQVTLTATVSAASGQPTGSVSFQDTTSSTAIGSASVLPDGTASISTSSLAVGDHAIVAHYAGSTAYNGSDSNEVTETILAAPPPKNSSVTLSASLSSTTYDDPVTFTANVSGDSGTPDGDVKFVDDNGSVLGTRALVAGSASFTTRVLATGSHDVTAYYEGTPTWAAGASSPVALTVDAVTGGLATAFQNTTVHDGASSSQLDTVTLHQAWQVNLGSAATGSSPTASYPLIADGRVFVVVIDSVNGQYVLYALDAATGAVDWWSPMGSTYAWFGLTYDGGQVFTDNSNGTLTAFDAETGHQRWSAAPGQYLYSAPPTAYDGVLYASGSGSSGTIFALSEDDGSVLWSHGIENGDQGSPVVDATGVYLTQVCDDAYHFSLLGTLLWTHTGNCDGGGGATSSLHSNALYYHGYGPDSPVIFDAGTGDVIGTFGTSPVPPAFDNQHMYLTQNNSLVALDPSGSPGAWTFTGDGHIATDAITTPSTVFVASSAGHVYGVSPSTGLQTWSASIPSGATGSDSFGTHMGIAVGQDLLVVPAGGVITAFVN
jgi:outer membrane protein assembly factor BamB